MTGTFDGGKFPEVFSFMNIIKITGIFLCQWSSIVV